jgi:hypothetical protein
MSISTIKIWFVVGVLAFGFYVLIAYRISVGVEQRGRGLVDF